MTAFQKWANNSDVKMKMRVRITFVCLCLFVFVRVGTCEEEELSERKEGKGHLPGM